MDIRSYFQFKEYVVEVFAESGFKVERLYKEKDQKVDLRAEKDNLYYYVEVKLRYISNDSIFRLIKYAKDKKCIPIFVVGQILSNKYKEKIKELSNNELIIIDLPNLLYATKSNEKLYNNILGVLPKRIDKIYEEKGFLESETLCHGNYIENLIGELKKCKKGIELFSTYEDICSEILKSVFENDLCLWKKQEKSNQNLYRFDLICRVKEENRNSFWSIIENYFNSKYVVFEFKNYGSKITQKEIYTTEKYLYAKALRTVAIIIAASGYDENAYWAVKGTLREQGKLIILLTSDDLIKMLKMKSNVENQSDFLVDKLDDLLIELEK